MRHLEKRYLADGVYASYDGFHVILTTDGANGTTNEIYLDYSVSNRLLSYFENAWNAKITVERAKPTGVVE